MSFLPPAMMPRDGVPAPTFLLSFLHRFWFRVCVAGSADLVSSSLLLSFVRGISDSGRLRCCLVLSTASPASRPWDRSSTLHPRRCRGVLLRVASIHSAASSMRYRPRRTSPLFECRGSARGLVNLLPRSLHALRGARGGSSMHGARGLPIRARTEPFLASWKSVSFRASALVSIVPLVLVRLILGLLLSREMPNGNHAPYVSGCLLGWVMRCWGQGKQFDISLFGSVNAQHAVQCFAHARDVLVKVRSWSIHIFRLASGPWWCLPSGPEHTRQAQCYTTSTPHHLLQLSIEYYFSHPTQV